MPVQTPACTAPPSEASASLAQQIVGFLEQLLTQSQQQAGPLAPVAKRGRGRPPPRSLQQLWLARLIGIIRQAKHLSHIWRWLCLQPTASFAPVHLTYEAVGKRRLSAGTQPLPQLFETVSLALGQWRLPQQPSALAVAAFAVQILALDETTRDAAAPTDPRVA